MTTKQAALVAEIKQMESLLDLDYRKDPADFTPWRSMQTSIQALRLKTIKDKLVRIAVVHAYVKIDEHLGTVMAWDLFGNKKSFPQLWGTRKFKAFNYCILERLYLLQKLDWVDYLHELPRKIKSDIRAVNDLRNAMAHTFFVENRRTRPMWKGKDIFTVGGLSQFHTDTGAIYDYFLERFWGAKITRTAAVARQVSAGSGASLGVCT